MYRAMYLGYQNIGEGEKKRKKLTVFWKKISKYYSLENKRRKISLKTWQRTLLEVVSFP